MKNVRKVLILAVCFSLLLLSFIYPVMAQESFLKWAVAHTASTLDPAAWATATVGQSQVYETLFRFKPGTSDVAPFLAESYDVSPDKKTYTVRLRKGVKFHDGTLFNAQAVVFSFERTQWYKGAGFAWLRVIESVTAVDSFTIRFVLKYPSPLFLIALANPNILPIVSPTAVKAHEKGGDWAKAWLDTNDAGTGPYTYQKAVKNDFVYLEKFKDYWRGWGGKHIDKVLFKYVREASSRKMMLLNKEMDVAEDLLFEDVDDLEKVPYIKVVLLPENTVTMLRCRLAGADNPLRNPKVREAIACAINYDEMIKVAMKGAARQGQGPLARGLFEHNNNLKVYKRDVNKAKELLKEAGYKPGEIKLIIMFNVGYDWKRLASETLMNNLSEVGIALDMYTTTWPGLAASLQDGVSPPPPHLYLQYSSPVIDGYTLLFRWYHSTSIGDPKKGVIGWNVGYSNPEFDKLLSEAQVALDMGKYKEAIWKAQELWLKDFPDIPLWELVVVSSMSKRVKGFVSNPNWVADINLYDMYLEN